NGGHIFVTFKGGGANGNLWTNISGGLDGAPVREIIPNPTRDKRDAYAVTTTGVFYIADAAAYDPNNARTQWQNITGNLFQLQYALFPTNGSSSTPLIDQRLRAL